MRWLMMATCAIAPLLLARPVQPAPSPDLLLQQGNQYYQAGQLAAAVQTWQQSKLLYQQAQNPAGEGTALARLGEAYVVLEHNQKAITTLEAYLPLARSLHNRLGEAEALGNLGIAYEALGKYGKALESHRAAGRIMRSLNDQPGLAKVLLNLGNTFEAVGDYDNAQTAYQQSLNIARQIGDRSGEAIALSNLGAVYVNLGQYQPAIAQFEASLTLARASQNFSSAASALINLGSAHHSLSLDRKIRSVQLQKAIQYYQQGLAVATRVGDRKRQGEALGSLGLAYEDLKQYPKAIAYYRQSLAIARAAGNVEAQGIALNNLGHALFAAGQLTAAATYLRETIKLLDARRPGLNDAYKVSIFDTQVHSYSLLQQILVAAQQYDVALEVAEQGRARAFAELLAQRSNPEFQKQPASMTPSAQQIRQIAQQQNATLVEYAIVPDDEFKFRGKQQAREAELFIWVVQPNGTIRFRRVDLKPLWQKGATLAEVVQVSRCLSPGDDCGAVARSLRTSDPSTSSKTGSRRPQPGLRQLYDLLIQPIADLLPQNPNSRVILIPQASLFLVPFAALQSAQGAYLVERHTLLTAPSIQLLSLTQQQNSRQSQSTSKPVVVGNPTMPSVSLEPGEPAHQLSPLPGAEAEAIQVAGLLNTQAIVGDAATKAAIVPQLSNARVIHLATHGLLEYGTATGHVSLQGLGVPGAIALAPSASDNGLLTANEILNLRLQAELVVLSACNTGQGRITGDGVIGLSRAFMAAGVPSVVVSLWSVPDAPTGQLMTTFYQNLQHQPDKARALRQAMLETMQTYPRPLDWAAFIVIGEAL